MTAVEVLGSINWTWDQQLPDSDGHCCHRTSRPGLRHLPMWVLSDGHLSWRQSFNVTFLWEFASALTPSVVGGSGIAMFIIGM